MRIAQINTLQNIRNGLANKSLEITEELLESLDQLDVNMDGFIRTDPDFSIEHKDQLDNIIPIHREKEKAKSKIKRKKFQTENRKAA